MKYRVYYHVYERKEAKDLVEACTKVRAGEVIEDEVKETRTIDHEIMSANEVGE